MGSRGGPVLWRGVPTGSASSSPEGGRSEVGGPCAAHDDPILRGLRSGVPVQGESRGISLSPLLPGVVQGAVAVPAGRADVYSLTVEDDHNFIVAGFVARNCDQLRYLLVPVLDRRTTTATRIRRT